MSTSEPMLGRPKGQRDRKCILVSISGKVRYFPSEHSASMFLGRNGAYIYGKRKHGETVVTSKGGEYFCIRYPDDSAN